jgi:hypothetical protein
MPEPPLRATAEYDISVFINCPFDDGYLPIFRAMIFTVYECGLIPRCAQEIYDAGQVRIEKIVALIKGCRWGIHDISMTELNARNLPRFNMPLELGLFIGASRYGAGRQARKSCIVLDRDQYRYQEFISDIAGQDIAAHGDDPNRAIHAVRGWLATSGAGVKRPAGGAAIAKRYLKFIAELPQICEAGEIQMTEVTFVDFADMASTWLKQELHQRS